MYDVVLLALSSERDNVGGCGTSELCCGSSDRGPQSSASGDSPVASTDADPRRCGDSPRVPVLACAEALTASGARVETITARSDAEIDAVLARLDGPPRPDGLRWPDPDGKTRLVVAAATDGQLRAVLRRMVRRYAPPPSRRPAELPTSRTIPDLPPIGLLPLDPTGVSSQRDLAAQLDLPRQPAEVAAAVLGAATHRLDLLRNDGGSITLDGVLLGAADDTGRPLTWHGRVEVDDKVLSNGDDPLLACAIGNGSGYAVLDGLPLLTTPNPADGTIEVAVAVPVPRPSLLNRKRVRFEVRRSRGRAVCVTPRDEVPYVDDGVAGKLGRKRSWWVEATSWAVYNG